MANLPLSSVTVYSLTNKKRQPRSGFPHSQRCARKLQNLKIEPTACGGKEHGSQTCSEARLPATEMLTPIPRPLLITPATTCHRDASFPKVAVHFLGGMTLAGLRRLRVHRDKLPDQPCSATLGERREPRQAG